jgi:PTS system ascorbate-specific IIC component
MQIIIFIATQILGQAFIVLGLVALIGLVALKKEVSAIISGTVKTMLGLVILGSGCGVVLGALTPLSGFINSGLGVDGVVPLNFFAFSKTMGVFGSEVALIFVIGFVINLFLARFTPIRFVALTVHMQLFWSALMVLFLSGAGISGASLIIWGGILSALNYWLVPAITYVFMKDDITDEHSLYTSSLIGILIGVLVSKILGKGTSTEEFKVSKNFQWVKDTVVAIAVIMFIVYIVFGLIAGVPAINEISGDTYWLIFLLSNALTFAGGVAIILYGVRMFLAEIIPAFTGFANKFLPNAIMGLDYPTVYPYAGTAVIIGFLGHLIGGILAVVVMISTGFSPLVVPAIEINFFEGALVGVFANTRGGTKSVIVSTLIVGFALQFVTAFTYPMTGIMSTSGTAFECIDHNTVGWITAKFINIFTH